MGDQQYPEPPELMRIQEMLMRSEHDGGEAGTLQLRKALTSFVRAQKGNYQYSYLPILKADDAVDVVNQGKYACAYFVTSCLHHFGLVARWNTWVREVSAILEASGWKKIPESNLSVMDVIIYDFHNGNQHIGFYDGEHDGDLMVISTALTGIELRDSDDGIGPDWRAPQRHHWKYEGRSDGPRTIQSCWTHPALHI